MMSLTAQAAATALGPLYEQELAGARAAIGRDDSEALHDLRVALRRLAVLVEQLAESSTPRQTLLHDIKRLLQQSNQGRDVQVMLNWLDEQWPHLTEAERIGARWWQRKLQRLQRHRRLRPEQLTIVWQRLPPALAKLSPRHAMARQPLGLLVAHRLEQQAGALSALMKGDDATERLHLIRLKVKTVRYLLLPCSGGALCAQAEAVLQQMQTALGAWHDAVLRQRHLNRWLRNTLLASGSARRIRAAERLVAERSPVVPGLLCLARSTTLAQAHWASLIKRQYLHDGGAPLTLLLAQAVVELRKAATLCD